MQQNQTIIMFFKMTKTNTTPWDGVMTGAGAQEESLFRRTTFFRSLYKFTNEYAGKRWYDSYVTL